VDLIYIDPPFDTGADFSFQVEIEDEDFTKQPSIIEQKAYRDTWGHGLDSYLQWFYETIVLLRDLLTENGSIYVHLDWHVEHYAKVVLDEIFDEQGFKNEIVWKRTSGHSDAQRYGNVHDILLYYCKSDSPVWNQPYQAYDEEYVRQYYRYTDPDGRKWMSDNLSAAGLSGGGYTYAWKNVTRTWRCPRSTMERLDQEGKIYYTRNGIPRLKRYLDESKGGLPAQDIWSDVEAIRSWHQELVKYPTQKPESLLERIIKASSNEGDLVLDCFCGSGTTAAVAEKLGRRWITADLGRFAIHTARKRLLGIPNVRPFVVQNLGKYERQVWQAAEFGERAEAAALAYRAFILDLYHARALTGYTWLHGLKNGRMVHVGSVDAPVSPGDVTNIVTEFRRTIGTGADAPKERGVDVLGWDFAFQLHEVAKQQAALAGIDVRFVRIPREVLEKKAVEQGDIRFFELAALSVVVQQKGHTVTLALSDFIIPLDDVPEDVQRAITHWSQWVDYWAVDWDNKSDTFHNEWQSYRTRASKDLQKQVAHTYAQLGTYTIVVKVIDLLGNDTTKTLNVVVS